MAIAAAPGPVNRPRNITITSQAAVGRALLAQVGVGLALQVVMDDVSARRLQVPLLAVGAALGERLGGRAEWSGSG